MSEWSQREAVRHKRSEAEVADRELGSSSQSIEVQAEHDPKLSNTYVITESFPAGMEPMGIERHRRSPKGELSGESESIEVQVKACTRTIQLARYWRTVPGGNGADGNRAT